MPDLPICKGCPYRAHWSDCENCIGYNGCYVTCDKPCAHLDACRRAVQLTEQRLKQRG